LSPFSRCCYYDSLELFCSALGFPFSFHFWMFVMLYIHTRISLFTLACLLEWVLSPCGFSLKSLSIFHWILVRYVLRNY
jgi:hypothetical protein